MHSPDKRLSALFGVLVVTGIMVGVLAVNILPQFVGVGSSTEYPDIFNARQLLTESDRIIVGRFEGDTTHEIPIRSPVTGRSTGSVTEVYRKFTITESLKGDATDGDSIHVVFTKRTVMRDTSVGTIDDTFDIVPLTKGGSYFLFLEGLSRPSGYPDQYGDTVWIIPGEPGIATADPNGTLIFAATARYRQEAGTAGAESAAPFKLTKQQITGGNSTR